MRTRSFVGFSFAVFIAATAVATLTEPRYPTMGKFIWPGSGVTFLILLLHANYFGHPLLITCLDIFFNALLYTGIAAALRRLLHIGTNEREVLGSRADCLHCIARSSCIK